MLTIDSINAVDIVNIVDYNILKHYNKHWRYIRFLGKFKCLEDLYQVLMFHFGDDLNRKDKVTFLINDSFYNEEEEWYVGEAGFRENNFYVILEGYFVGKEFYEFSSFVLSEGIYGDKDKKCREKFFNFLESKKNMEDRYIDKFNEAVNRSAEYYGNK